MFMIAILATIMPLMDFTESLEKVGKTELELVYPTFMSCLTPDLCLVSQRA